MTIYIVKWIGTETVDDPSPQFYACSSQGAAKGKHKEIRELMKGDNDIDIAPENEAVTKNVIKTQDEVIDLINSLLKPNNIDD